MAPEQATGGTVDARADVHALAAVVPSCSPAGRLATARSPSSPTPRCRSLDPSPAARYASMPAFVDAFAAAFAAAYAVTTLAR